MASGDDSEVVFTLTEEIFRDHFSCAICMCTIKHTRITVCGHRYCEECIKDCVDRLHKCPLCNRPLKETDLIKDFQFDSLIDSCRKEKCKAEKNFFDAMFKAVVERSKKPQASVLNNEDNCVDTKNVSPLEYILRRHMKGNLAAHQEYLTNMQRDFENKESQVNVDYEMKMNIIDSSDLSDSENGTLQLQLDRDEKIARLHEEMDNCIKMVSVAYDNYLTKYIPSLHVLPVSITLCVPHKDVFIPYVRLNPDKSVEDIQAIVEQFFKGQGDPIALYEDIHFVYLGPFAKLLNSHELNDICDKVVNHGANQPDVFLLSSGCKPQLKHGLKHGSLIVMYGKIKCQSDLPKYCFSVTYKEDEEENSAVDYFSCKQCNLNWICRPCMDVCHNGHTGLSPYIRQHKPTWACCYCQKKKKCQLLAKSGVS